LDIPNGKRIDFDFSSYKTCCGLLKYSYINQYNIFLVELNGAEKQSFIKTEIDQKQQQKLTYVLSDGVCMITRIRIPNNY
jgi:hypothetical protein